MEYEYAVRNEAGQLWGLPAATYVTEEAAREVLTFVEERRSNMKREAQMARKELTGPLFVGTPADKADLEEAIHRWDLEKDRSWAVARREVGQWQTI